MLIYIDCRVGQSVLSGINSESCVQPPEVSEPWINKLEVTRVRVLGADHVIKRKAGSGGVIAPSDDRSARD